VTIPAPQREQPGQPVRLAGRVQVGRSPGLWQDSLWQDSLWQDSLWQDSLW
jgi:hypothetical protein